jgi:NitT/TauT family transport system substrate-binding protein
MVTTTSFGKASFLIMAGLLGVVATTSAQAEVAEVSLARQYGLHYLPLVLMERNNLIEKHAKAAKVDLKVSWKQFSGGASVNEALISGALNIVAGGTGPLVTIWDKTKSNMGVKGFAAISEVPMVLLSRNPAFKSLKDISPKDRIALPAVKTSMQAITLQMAAAKLYGAKEYTKLDSQTVSMAHPDGVAAMLSGKLEVNAHFTAPPYSYKELENPAIHRVMTSYDVYGGRATLIVIYGTTKFYDENPTVVKIVLAALQEAIDMTNANRRKAVEEYIEVTKEKLDPNAIERFVADKDVGFDIAPKGIFKVAEFMHSVGSVKNMPGSWKDMFFPTIHDKAGN